MLYILYSYSRRFGGVRPTRKASRFVRSCVCARGVVVNGGVAQMAQPTTLSLYPFPPTGFSLFPFVPGRFSISPWDL